MTQSDVSFVCSNICSAGQSLDIMNSVSWNLPHARTLQMVIFDLDEMPAAAFRYVGFMFTQLNRC
jgi:hypothetical protein